MARDDSSPGAVYPGSATSPADRELLRAVRDLISADRSMRRELSVRSGVGESDLRALRFVMSATREGRETTPHDLAEHLGISSASTTVLLDRLTAAGHVARVPHPTDRRSKLVIATEHAYRETRSHLTGTHDRMCAAAAEVPASARPAVLAFLEALTAVMVEDGSS